MADICVRAVNAVGVVEDGERLVDLSDIKVEKRQGGSIKDSTLIDGILLDKERSCWHAKIREQGKNSPRQFSY